jgi:hypothetical protein
MAIINDSILTSTKKILGISAEYTAFDLDVITHINAAFAVVNQLGLGPVDGFFIEDDSEVWGDLQLPPRQLSLVRTYIYLKTRILFDPPTLSYLVEALKQQLQEHEHRMLFYVEYFDGDNEIMPVGKEVRDERSRRVS